MHILVKKYNFKDINLLNQDITQYGFDIFFPSHRAIILGRGNKPFLSINEQKVYKDSIPVYKRPSGGETVLISPETLIISILKKNVLLPSFNKFYTFYNCLIIDALESLGIKGLNLNGISDICIWNKKIYGSSMYYTSNQIFYHGVLNIRESIKNIERYIKQPLREPAYRAKRPHKEFVTSISNEGYSVTNELIRNRVELHVSQSLTV